MHGTLQEAKHGAGLDAYLYHVKAQGYRDRILRGFDRADQLKVAFVGETIVDEYRYVAPLAKPSKEFIMAGVQSGAPEQFMGGVVAASLHADWPNLKVVTRSDNPIRKTRFVDVGFTRKLFEVYSSTNEPSTDTFTAELITAARDCDAMVVFDFGHGLMGPRERHIAESAKFLAVNAQTNAGNYGFNPVTKYRSSDLICVDEPEARIAVGMQTESINAVAATLEEQAEPKTKIIITLGRNGCMLHYDGSPRLIPPFSGLAVDTMGAGDAFLAVAAPLMAGGLDLEAAAFAGNVAGALKVGIVGHRSHVTREMILARIEELLG